MTGMHQMHPPGRLRTMGSPLGATFATRRSGMRHAQSTTSAYRPSRLPMVRDGFPFPQMTRPQSGYLALDVDTRPVATRR